MTLILDQNNLLHEFVRRKAAPLLCHLCEIMTPNEKEGSAWYHVVKEGNIFIPSWHTIDGILPDPKPKRLCGSSGLWNALIDLSWFSSTSNS